MSFIQDKAPHLLIFDFDQTLCETKSGCVPDKLKHGLNPYLFQLALAWQVRRRQDFAKKKSVPRRSSSRQYAVPKG